MDDRVRRTAHGAEQGYCIVECARVEQGAPGLGRVCEGYAAAADLPGELIAAAVHGRNKTAARQGYS